MGRLVVPRASSATATTRRPSTATTTTRSCRCTRCSSGCSPCRRRAGRGSSPSSSRTSCSGSAIVLLVRLTEPRFGKAVAYRSAALMALFPFSAAFSMAYAESLFMVLALGAFLAVGAASGCSSRACCWRSRRSPGSRGRCWSSRWRGCSGRTPGDRGRSRLGRAAARAARGASRRSRGSCWLTGDAGSYSQAQGDWGRVGLGARPAGVARRRACTGRVAYVHLIDLVVLIGAVFLFVFVRVDRIPLPVRRRAGPDPRDGVRERQHPVHRPADPARVPQLLDPRQARELARAHRLAGGVDGAPVRDLDT